MDSSGFALLGSLIGCATLLGLAGIVGGFLHHRRERLLTHQERMKALELGHALPDDAATARVKAAFGVSEPSGGDASGGRLARWCFSTALWVGFWGFLFASQADVAHGSSAVAVAIAASAGAVGVTAMICGTILAFRTPPAPAQAAAAKPFVDRDAFDVVSHGG